MMSYQPFEIAKNFRILPVDHEPSTDGRIDLIMQRGAFGSGEHETTKSCLEILEGLTTLQNSRLLDLGSGTGILAIAALKLGAAEAVCLDIDPQAVQTARINCEKNGVLDRTCHRTGTLDTLQDTGFDLVLANIYGDILQDLAAALTHKVNPGGTLLLSGILWEHNFDVRQAYEKRGCLVLKNHMLEEFSSVELQRTSRPDVDGGR